MMLKCVIGGIACICLATFVTNIVERSTGNAWYGRGTGIVVATISGFVLYLFVRWSNKDGEK